MLIQLLILMEKIFVYNPHNVRGLICSAETESMIVKIRRKAIRCVLYLINTPYFKLMKMFNLVYWDFYAVIFFEGQA